MIDEHDLAARPHHAREFVERRSRLGHDRQHIGRDDAGEARVARRRVRVASMFTRPATWERRSRRDALRGASQHRLGQIDADDLRLGRRTSAVRGPCRRRRRGSRPCAREAAAARRAGRASAASQRSDRRSAPSAHRRPRRRLLSSVFDDRRQKFLAFAHRRSSFALRGAQRRRL